MASPFTIEDLKRLTVNERLQMLQLLYETLDEEQIELTDAQKAELDLRLEDIKQHPHDEVPAEEVIDALKKFAR